MAVIRYSSRKFVIAGASLVVVSFLAVWGVVVVGKEGGLDVAAIIGAWGVCDAAILKLYNDANLKANGQ